jgi:hypothetical protein
MEGYKTFAYPAAINDTASTGSGLNHMHGLENDEVLDGGRHDVTWRAKGE